MSLPSEYTLEDVVSSIDDINVHVGNHPIHGKVNVYLPDKTLPPQFAAVAKRRLYRMGLQLRNLSMLDVPLLARALEVSQNPNEPYIVTAHTEQDFDRLISNGITIKPKRMFSMLTSILQAVINLASDGWIVDRINPRQIKLPDAEADEILFSIVEGAQQQIDLGGQAPPSKPQRPAVDRMDRGANRTMAITQKIEDDEPPDDPDRTQRIQGDPSHTQELSGGPDATQELPFDPDATAAVEANVYERIAEQKKETTCTNIGILGQMTYQLLFGRQFEVDDESCLEPVRKLARRWRRILEKALSREEQQQYPDYQAILKDLKKASSRNRRAALASIPVLVIVAAAGSYMGYERYREHKIATSEAGQAIKNFLDVVSTPDDTFQELELPAPPAEEPNEEQIMEPFRKISETQ